MSSSENAKLIIDIKDYGAITVELDAEAAPITVANFLKLTDQGFYDGLTFHRIISGFMIQGGDPLGNGMGGSDENIKGEFAANGVRNPISHKRGVISMARAMDPNSASSQFFIMHENAPYLDGQYAAFGYVTSGIEVVDKICENVPVIDRNGTVLKNDQPVIESIKRVQEN
ncbi:MAG: peptidylprolyl isomerase [Lachnospiraceae bacterium]|nr:peptidylprolyl isomerase [Lachnospiraceae bacterium]